MSFFAMWHVIFRFLFIVCSVDGETLLLKPEVPMTQHSAR